MLDSPVHRCVPQSDSTLDDDQVVQVQQSLQDDPFIESTSSPSVARNNLAALRAAADEANRVISSVRVRRGRPRQQNAIAGLSTRPVIAPAVAVESSTALSDPVSDLHADMENLHLLQESALLAANQLQPPPLASVQLPPVCRPFDKNRVHYSDLESMDVICPSCKALHWMAEKLTKSSQRNPKFGMCCYSGKIDLPLLHQLP